jgi:hypothetical protein
VLSGAARGSKHVAAGERQAAATCLVGDGMALPFISPSRWLSLEAHRLTIGARVAKRSMG